MVLENPTLDLNAIRNKLNAGGRSVTWVSKHLSVSHWTRLRRIDSVSLLFARENTLRDCCLCVVTRRDQRRGENAENLQDRGRLINTDLSNRDSSSTEEKSRASRGQRCEIGHSLLFTLLFHHWKRGTMRLFISIFSLRLIQVYMVRILFNGVPFAAANFQTISNLVKTFSFNISLTFNISNYCRALCRSYDHQK